MTLILLYLLVLVLVAGLLFVIASAVFGRGEPLPPLPRATTATALPALGVTGADIDAVKFTQTLRGYKTSDVDWVLDRLSREIELLRGQVSALRAPVDEPLGRRAEGGDEPLGRRAEGSDEPLGRRAESSGDDAESVSGGT